MYFNHVSGAGSTQNGSANLLYTKLKMDINDLTEGVGALVEVDRALALDPGRRGLLAQLGPDEVAQLLGVLVLLAQPAAQHRGHKPVLQVRWL